MANWPPVYMAPYQKSLPDQHTAGFAPSAQHSRILASSPGAAPTYRAPTPQPPPAWPVSPVRASTPPFPPQLPVSYHSEQPPPLQRYALKQYDPPKNFARTTCLG